MSLMDHLDAYNQLLARKDELAQLTTDNNKAIEKARLELTNAMIDEEVEKISRGGYSYTLTEKVQFSKRGGVDEELFETLRNDGLGDIIKEKVDPRTLNATLRELTERNDGELPEQYLDLVSVYRYMDVGRRKG